MTRAFRYTDARHPTLSPHCCVQCGRRKARYNYRGRVAADPSHSLCPRCFESVLDSARFRWRVAVCVPIAAATSGAAIVVAALNS